MTDITNSGFIPKKRTVCALGLFDGVHRGHQLIITTAVKKAQSLDGHSAVFCFKTDTVTSKGHDGRIEMLMSDEEKHKKMAELGVEVLFSPDFAEFKGMSPEDFVKKVLKGSIAAVQCAETILHSAKAHRARLLTLKGSVKNMI